MGLEYSYSEKSSYISSTLSESQIDNSPKFFSKNQGFLSSSVYSINKTLSAPSPTLKSLHYNFLSPEKKRKPSAIEENYKKIFGNNLSSSVTNTKKTDSENNNIINHEFKNFNNLKELNKNTDEKLIQKETLKAGEVSSYNTLFIFDWDDTFFFTTYLSSNLNNFSPSMAKKQNLSIKDQKKIELIEYYLKLIFDIALKRGIVFIITNSSEGWVQETAKRYYPQLYSLLNKVNIISARALYENKYPNNREMWKLRAFEDIQKKYKLDKNKLTNIISIGDNENEIQASKILAGKFNNAIVKTIKFREEPDLIELIKELKLIEQQLIRIYDYSKNLTIKVEKINKDEIKKFKKNSM